MKLTPITASAALLLFTVSSLAQAEKPSPPKINEMAKPFALKTLDDRTVKLYDLTKKGPVVLVVLRGYPGYQCPICTRQVADLRSKAKAFQEAGASVVLIYPGPADNLKKRAKEFLDGDTLPDGFTLVIDPDYKFTNDYGLRWDAPKETAYPSSFVISKENKVVSAHISKTHGGRTKAKALVKTVQFYK